MKFFRKAFGIIQVLFVISVAMLYFCMFLKFILEPIAPVITILFVLLFTLITFNRLMTVILSIGGIALYAASWPVVNVWGVWPSVLICLLGILIWFAAVFMSFLDYTQTTKEVVAA